MPRKPIDLDPYKNEIIGLFRNDNTIDTIVSHLQTRHQLRVQSRTLKSRLREWGIRKLNPPTTSDSALHARVKVLFFEAGLEEDEMLTALTADGYRITAQTLKRLRLKLGFLRRTNPALAEQQVEEIVKAIETELESGIIEGYGRELLHKHFRSKGYMIARLVQYILDHHDRPQINIKSRDRLYSLYRSVAPAAVERRLKDFQRKKGKYIVPGPDFVWCIDGYMKLELFGIEIYAAIDGYSRYIIWTYVGISARTAVSVSHQYLAVILMNGRYPRFIRSDHGSETVMIAGAHHRIHQAHTPDITPEKCYIYGTSTENTRIESWWGQLSKGMVYRWRVSCRSPSFIPI